MAQTPTVRLSPELLKRARLRKGLTMRQLAARCAAAGKPIDAGQIARYENGKFQPVPANIPVLAAALGYGDDVDALLEVA